jgi:carbon monoxide dehydrogenase subunit G
VRITAARLMPDADPQDVWDVIADPHRHVLTLPSSVSEIEVHDNGDIACVVSAMGKSERMLVRRTLCDPPRRLVEERVDGRRKGRTEFTIEPDATGSRVTVVADVDLPMLVGAVAKGPIESGLKEQLAGLEREASG